MANKRVKALAAAMAAEAIRNAIPSKNDLLEAELYWPENGAQVIQELERIANEMQAKAQRLEAL